MTKKNKRVGGLLPVSGSASAFLLERSVLYMDTAIRCGGGSK